MNIPTHQEIQNAIQNVASGKHTHSDLAVLRSAYFSNQISITGSGNVGAGGNIAGSMIIAGNGNSIIVQGQGASAISRITRPFSQEIIRVLSSWLVLSAGLSAMAVLSATSNHIEFFSTLLAVFPAICILGGIGIIYERIFKNKEYFDHSFMWWSIYPIVIIAEMEIKFILFAFKLFTLMK